jgi:chemosensory pili system protein ChpC
MVETHEIRALFAPIPGSGLLVPGSVVAEVIAYSEPDPFQSAPAWLLGELEWNGWQVPVVHIANLAGTSDENTVPPRSRILVVKTLSDSTSVLHVGLVISGMPKLRTVTTGNLVETGQANADGVFSHVTIEDQPAVIPDLDVLAVAIEKSVYRT